MIRIPFAKALRVILARLASAEINWAITESLCFRDLALMGDELFRGYRYRRWLDKHRYRRRRPQR